MKFLSILLSIIISAALLGMPSTGCATLQSVYATSGTPQTPQQRLDAMQADLDFAKGAANLAHELGKWQKSSDWAQVQAGFANAQLILNASRISIGDNTALTEADVTSLLNAAAQSIHDAKEAAK